MDVRIYQPAKTAMQSGLAQTHDWVLEYLPLAKKTHDPLTGWVGSADTREQVHLKFSSREEAVAYAETHRLVALVEEPHVKRYRPKSYADNFRPDRIR